MYVSERQSHYYIVRVSANYLVLWQIRKMRKKIQSVHYLTHFCSKTSSICETSKIVSKMLSKRDQLSHILHSEVTCILSTPESVQHVGFPFWPSACIIWAAHVPVLALTASMHCFTNDTGKWQAAFHSSQNSFSSFEFGIGQPSAKSFNLHVWLESWILDLSLGLPLGLSVGRSLGQSFRW